MHTEPRTGAITKIGIHTNEGPEYSGRSAEDLKQYLLNNGSDGGGYQAVADDDSVAIVVSDQTVCWANGGVNHESIDICIIGRASQSPQEWEDEFDDGALRQTARWVASKCVAYSIPPNRLQPEQLKAHAARGIFGHIDVTRAGFSGAEGHYDPGPGFPWSKFLALVRYFMGAPVEANPIEEEEQMIIKAPRRQQKKGPNRPACARLDIPGKRIILMNGAKVQQSSLDIPTKGEVRGWYEDFDSQWNSVGFTVIGAADAKKENPAFHFTWTK